MTKAKTNALDALRTLIAERQQYEQWIAALDSKREGIPEHVHERVKADYQSRLERVVADIGGHAEELQLSISTLSSRLVEVARDEDTRREGLQEAELRAAVGEYAPEQWEQLRSEAEKALEKIAADRASLDSQLGELRAIQKLSEAGSGGAVREVAPAVTQKTSAESAPEVAVPAAPALEMTQPPGQSGRAEPAPERPRAEESVPPPREAAQPQGRLPLDPAPPSTAPAASTAGGRNRSGRTPPAGVSAVRSKSEPAKADGSKTLKCPECGTPNYPTEWYCERCGGELATM